MSRFWGCLEEANFQNCLRISIGAVGYTQESPKDQSSWGRWEDYLSSIITTTDLMVDTMCLRVRVHQVYTLDTYNSKTISNYTRGLKEGTPFLISSDSDIGSLHVFIRSYSCSRSLSSSLSPAPRHNQNFFLCIHFFKNCVLLSLKCYDLVRLQ